jgi:HD superfamily phosphodiesterase
MRVSWDEGRSIDFGSGDDGNNQRISHQPVKHQKCPEMGSKPSVYLPKKKHEKVNLELQDR